MNKILFTILAALSLLVISCSKEGDNAQAISNKSVDEGQHLFSKEIVVSDETGKSTAYYRVYSEEKSLVNDYLTAYSLKLITGVDHLESGNMTDHLLGYDKAKKSDSYSDEEPKIFVEFITANLEEGVSGFQLDVKLNQLKSSNNWIMGYPVGYTTSNNFIGVVHYLEGWEILVKMQYKENWLSSWKYVVINGIESWWVGTNLNQYWLRFSTGNYNKRGLVIYPHRDQTVLNYKIAYSLEEFRGRDCAIGTYDSRNCHIGVAPVGTSAFMWPDRYGAHYYTPINGNQCPMPGSSFDGSSCFVVDIPENLTWGFTWNNNWYVAGNIIY
ncbi:MAG: hypothetical protein K0B15_12800 [Lentimicrobium sp.]|nr:hypothetical protein [Lentimicrobium sp.]